MIPPDQIEGKAELFVDKDYYQLRGWDENGVPVQEKKNANP